MADRQLTSPEVLRQLLCYEPDTGKLFWKERGPEWFGNGPRDALWMMRSWNAKHAGKEALTSLSCGGYFSGSILGVCLLAHRVVWAMQYGRWPDLGLDHVNGNKLDNRIVNLRAVDHFANTKNAKARRGTSGFKGVSWCNTRQKWVVYIQSDLKSRYVGYFDDEIAAARAYDAAASRFHGIYARLNFGGTHGG